MGRLFRVIVLLVVVPATYFFVYWVPFAFVSYTVQPWIASAISLLLAIGVGWFLWNKLGSAPSDLVSSVLSGGLILGGVAFCAGFIGPIVFAPGANQGPLLGIFITGPLGFVLGLVGGFIYWRIKKKKIESATAVKNQL